VKSFLGAQFDGNNGELVEHLV